MNAVVQESESLITTLTRIRGVLFPRFSRRTTEGTLPGRGRVFRGRPPSSRKGLIYDLHGDGLRRKWIYVDLCYLGADGFAALLALALQPDGVGAQCHGPPRLQAGAVGLLRRSPARPASSVDCARRGRLWCSLPPRDAGSHLARRDAADRRYRRPGLPTAAARRADRVRLPAEHPPAQRDKLPPLFPAAFTGAMAMPWPIIQS